MKSKQFVALVAVLLASAAIRVINLENNPPGFFIDEAAAAIDARSILETGRDMWGEKFPLFFKSLGDYNSGYHRYLMIPFISIFGSKIWSARLPVALVSLLTVIICFFIGKKLGGFRLGLLCALFFGFSPWSIMYGRVAMEQAFLPFFLSLVIWAILVWHEKEANVGSDLLLGALFGLTFYTYQTARLFVPLLFIGFIALELKRVGLKRAFIITIGLTLVLIPAINFAIERPEDFFARANVLASNYEQHTPFNEHLLSFLLNYFAHFSPKFLFFEGDANIRHSPTGFGMMYPLALFLIPLGFFNLFKTKRDLFWLFILVAVLFPIPSAITKRDIPHGLRTLTALPSLEILSALGLEFLFTKKERLKAATASIVIAEVVCFLFFANHLLFKYPEYAKLRWRWEHKQLFLMLDPYKESHQIVVHSYEAYAWVLAAYYWKIDPAEFQKTQKIFNLIMQPLHPDFFKYFAAPSGIFQKPSKDKPAILVYLADERHKQYLPETAPWRTIALPTGESVFFLYLYEPAER